MIEEISPDLFRIQVPLPNTPLKFLNSYVVRSPNRSLIIDTGLNHDTCFEALQAGLKEIGVDPARADLFITHLHADHFGLVARLATTDTRVYFNRPDAEIIESWEGFGPMLEYAGRNGFPVDRLRAALAAHPGSRFGSEWVPPLEMLADGDGIEAGPYRFRCVSTPGHTLGHMCLYEPRHKLLVSGDHILIDITPNIQCWTDAENPLKAYLESLDKVTTLEVNRTLPGHRRLMGDPCPRIAELKAHHRDRLAEVLVILAHGPRNAFDVAARMTWDIKADRWEDFPVAQQWFATGEALSHLRYLEEEGKIARLEKGDGVWFARVG
ncbi:MAG: MBL fold metallo-hydrolase [Desulfobacteraceae bacterium]|jgi:glyoxylase-like metal-dependent hydrolase (beta-lactamase superfamily II)|nr:MBL fold metallo-hydrolase [Desulfobacteraceae bacterium]